jgi:hypothetical protein
MPPFAPSNGLPRFVLDALSTESLKDVCERETQAGAPSSNGDNGGGSRSPRLPNGVNGAGKNGREANGRFAKGNAGGPGNPFARRTAALRRAFCEAVTEEDIRSLSQLLLVKAREGDLTAAKVLFAYAIGKPVETVDPDTLDLDEWQLFLRNPADVHEMVRVLHSMPTSLACTLLRLMLPNTESTFKNDVIQMLAPAPERKSRRKAAKVNSITTESPRSEG